MTNNQTEEYRISGKILTFGLMAIIFLAIVIAIGCMIFNSYLLKEKNRMASELISASKDLYESQRALGKCDLALSRSAGSLEAYKSVLINPQRNAILLAIDEYTDLIKDLGGNGEEIDPKKFKGWIKGRK